MFKKKIHSLNHSFSGSTSEFSRGKTAEGFLLDRHDLNSKSRSLSRGEHLIPAWQEPVLEVFSTPKSKNNYSSFFFRGSCLCHFTFSPTLKRKNTSTTNNIKSYKINKPPPTPIYLNCSGFPDLKSPHFRENPDQVIFQVWNHGNIRLAQNRVGGRTNPSEKICASQIGWTISPRKMGENFQKSWEKPPPPKLVSLIGVITPVTPFIRPFMFIYEGCVIFGGSKAPWSQVTI